MITRELIRASLDGPVTLPVLGGMIDLRQARAAAVVVAVALEVDPAWGLGPASSGPSALVVLRGAQLHEHAGEVGFPGGKPDPGDADLAATALRELTEEVGVTAGQVELLGELNPTPVITGRYLIHPFVGVLGPGAAPRVASPEIARVILMPLLPLLTGAQPIAAVRGEWKGVAIFAPHFDLDGCVLYGASAYILYELLGRLAARLGWTLPPATITKEAPWGDRYAR